ncbi:MAG: hypothetical protein RMI79_05000 [Nitrososphaerota archaeon]|nr:hypothetical protein [Nitrososphaerota archaeon]
MTKRIIMIIVVDAIILVAISIIINAKNNDVCEIKEYNIVDDYGSIHELIEVDDNINVKYKPKYHTDITTWSNYIKTRYKSWDKHKTS